MVPSHYSTAFFLPSNSGNTLYARHQSTCWWLLSSLYAHIQKQSKQTYSSLPWEHNKTSRTRKHKPYTKRKDEIRRERVTANHHKQMQKGMRPRMWRRYICCTIERCNAEKRNKYRRASTRRRTEKNREKSVKNTIMILFVAATVLQQVPHLLASQTENRDTSCTKYHPPPIIVVDHGAK